MTEPNLGPGEEPIQVTPVVVLVQVFPARPSSIPDIRDFVRRCLAESPLTEEGNREVGETVFRALLDAAGPTGFIQVAFRIFPEHVEVDVLHSDTQIQPLTPASAPRPAMTSSAPSPDNSVAAADPGRAAAAVPAGVQLGQPGHPATFADWMSTALRREGLTQEAAARRGHPLGKRGGMPGLAENDRAGRAGHRWGGRDRLDGHWPRCARVTRVRARDLVVRVQHVYLDVLREDAERHLDGPGGPGRVEQRPEHGLADLAVALVGER